MSNPDFLDYDWGEGHHPLFAVHLDLQHDGPAGASIPLHWSKDGLPVGVHFAARFGDEATLLKLAVQLEQARPWFGKRPVLTRD